MAKVKLDGSGDRALGKEYSTGSGGSQLGMEVLARGGVGRLPPFGCSKVFGLNCAPGFVGFAFSQQDAEGFGWLASEWSGFRGRAIARAV